MNLKNYEDMNDEFFSRLDEELPNFGFLPEEQFSRKTYLSDPQPMNSLFEEPDTLNFIYSSESQDSSQTGEPHSELKDSSKKGSKKNLPDPIAKKSRKISKKEEKKPRGKARTAKITETTVLAGEIPDKYIPEEFNNPDIDDKTRKKMLQAIRNRVAAQNSRDKKKNQFSVLEEQNEKLIQENNELKELVKKLEESNAALKRENQEYRSALETAQAYKSDDQKILQKRFLENGFLKTDPFEPSESGMVPSTESSNPSGSESPIVRRSYHRSGGYLKYSLALATIFAVLMFNGINSPDVAVPNYNSNVYPPTSERYTSYTPSTKAPQNKGRILAERYDLDDEMDIEAEGIKDENLTCVSPTYEKFSYANYLGTAQQSFNEQFMSQFFSQLKIYEPIQQFNTDQPAKKESDFSSYLSASRNQFSPIKESKASESGVSSIFCPAGFEFNRDGGNSDSNGQSETKTEKQLKLKDSEWLQLFIPKQNISVSESGIQNGLSIPSQEKTHNDNEDNKILEVWCKIFSVKELSSRFSS